jgi:hypothetical protein
MQTAVHIYRYLKFIRLINFDLWDIKQQNKIKNYEKRNLKKQFIGF